jgi:hypothetical protein
MTEVVGAIFEESKAGISSQIQKVKEAAALGIEIDNFRGSSRLDFLLGSLRRRVCITKMEEKVLETTPQDIVIDVSMSTTSHD